MANGYRMWAGEKGTKIKRVGADDTAYRYTSLSTCLEDAQPNDVIYLEDGTYTLTSTATINYNLKMIGIGRVSITGDVADRLFMLNKPASGSAITYIEFHNIRFSNDNSGADVFEIDNDGGSTGALKTKFFDCGITATSGLAIDLDQTTNTIDVELVVKGYHSADLYLDSCNFGITKAANRVFVDGYLLDDGQAFACSTTDVAWILNFNNCIFSSSAITTGGSASFIMNATNCMKIASGAVAPLALGDFDATVDSENITVGTLAT